MIRTIEVEAFVDDDERPTCAKDVNLHMCRFIGTRKFGFVEVCLVTGIDLDREDGFLRPCKGCPVWENE